MALKSMTGFGEATVARNGVELTVSLSSVNRKQMDISVRMPSAMQSLEYRVQEMVKAQLSRGRINGTITMERSATTGTQSVSIDMGLAQAYVGELRKAGEALGLVDKLSSDVLLRVPGLISIEQKASTEDVLPVLEEAVNAALEKLLAMRVQEGNELAADFNERLKTLEGWMGEIETQSETIPAAYRAKLIDRLEKAGLENLAEDERVVKEIALFADRCDITEELTRLKSHIVQFRQFLEAPEAVGRSLDFLSQEFFREINTIGSKANDVEITRRVVAFKTELERIREQVQNVE
jgi:uncharacterized protein (TIGR00255 family)